MSEIEHCFTPESDVFTEAKSWREQIFHNQSVWLARSVIANAALLAALVVSAICLAVVASQKSIETIVVEKSEDGHFTVRDDVTPAKATQDWGLVRYHILHYVENRESYHPDNINRPYQEAYYMSDDKVRSELTKELNSDSKSSPIATYGKNQYVTVHVVNVQQIGHDSNTAMVDFTQTLHDMRSQQEKTVNKQALIRWQFSEKKQPAEWYYRNPFNFKTTFYQRQQSNLRGQS